MAYTHTTEATLYTDREDFVITYDVDYTVSRGYPATRVDPEEPPQIEVVRCKLTGPDKRALECPEWLSDLLHPSHDILLDDAAGQLEAAAVDRADMRRPFEGAA